MAEASLPRSSNLAWHDKPIHGGERHVVPAGLSAFLDRLRQVEYVTGLEARQYHPDLLVAPEFALAESFERLRAWYSGPQDPGTLEFDVLTTARTPEEQRAVLRDLRLRLLTR